MFKPVDPKQSFPKLEEKLIADWHKNKTFQKSVDRNSTDNEYVFYDGPPFATGLPHYGHLLAGTMKDVVPRYWTMRGKRVERRFGWDCHGLPIEYEVEKELKLGGRKDIVDNYGVHDFSEKCRSIVTRYSDEWRATVDRMGRWVDMDNDYKTMDPDFMESIWWVFGQLWEKGLVYEGHKSMHVCPRCVTPLSNFEVTLGYQDISDVASTVKFELTDRPNTYILAWTTTTWTLPGDMAIAVGQDIDYVEVESSENNERYIVAETYVEKMGEEFTVKKKLKGKDLIGLTYKPLFDFYKDMDGAEKLWRVFHGDFVATEEGTGVVHMAGGFGDDDMKLCQKNNLPIILHVGMDGEFKEEVTPWVGEFCKDKDAAIAKDLDKRGLLFKQERYKHSYPHCWRCDSPLLNYATSSWFVEVEAIKQKMLSENKKVHWVPEHVGHGRFQDWLENARDWAISRNRFWGTPLPIWRSEDGDIHVISGIEELQKLSGKKVEDLHKHLIDNITFEKDGKTYTRIEDVFDCWFESGSMPYAQMHYPFENKDKFEENFPAEYIAEGLDQTRGWFYTLTVLGVALFGKSPFKNVVVNGMILAEDGKKMSKRLKNYPDPNLIFDRYGADALRFYLMTSPAVKAEPLRFSEKGVENIVKSVILPIWNSYSFFVTYARIDKWNPTMVKPQHIKKLSNKLDRWLLSELHTLLKNVTEEMDDYNLQAIRHLNDFIEHLTNWYIRRSRRRFWKSEDDKDKEEGYQALYTALVTLSQVMAPVMPFLSESIYQNLTGGESVHLTEWPAFSKDAIDEKLNQEIELAQLVAQLGNATRAKAKIKNRQPLAKVQIGLAKDQQTLLNEDQLEILKEELNVKEIMVAKDPNELAKRVIRPDARQLGPKFGKEVQTIIKEAKAGKGTLNEDGTFTLREFIFQPNEFEIGYEGEEGMNIESDHGVVVALDTKITPELRQEGLVRDLVRAIQDLRKEANYNVDDRIQVAVISSGEVGEARDTFSDYIATETLATKITSKKLKASDQSKTIEFEGEQVNIEVTRCQGL
jgi:isoleucyl-tRNA synthetase